MDYGIMALWHCGIMARWLYGYMALWPFGYQAVVTSLLGSYLPINVPVPQLQLLLLASWFFLLQIRF